MGRRVVFGYCDWVKLKVVEFFNLIIVVDYYGKRDGCIYCYS